MKKKSHLQQIVLTQVTLHVTLHFWGPFHSHILSRIAILKLENCTNDMHFRHIMIDNRSERDKTFSIFKQGLPGVSTLKWLPWQKYVYETDS